VGQVQLWLHKLKDQSRWQWDMWQMCVATAEWGCSVWEAAVGSAAGRCDVG
jgi:hypothetical protein